MSKYEKVVYFNKSYVHKTQNHFIQPDPKMSNKFYQISCDYKIEIIKNALHFNANSIFVPTQERINIVSVFKGSLQSLYIEHIHRIRQILKVMQSFQHS